MTQKTTLKRFAVLTCLVGSVVGCGSGAHQTSSTKIVGGQVAQDRPFMAALVGKDTDFAFCDGTFIAPGVVLTAAHCVVGGTVGMRIAGGHRLNTGLTADKTAAVTAVVHHKDYNPNTNDNDVAMVFLKTTDLSRFGDRVHPAATSLETGLPESVGSATVAGWGAQSEGGNDYPDELREVTVPVVPRALCNSAGGGYASVTERQICAGDFAHGGIDSCQGDSGGPLFVERNNKVEVIGVVSWGNGCAEAHKPGVYTRVAAFQSWITQQIAAHH